MSKKVSFIIGLISIIVMFMWLYNTNDYTRVTTSGYVIAKQSSTLSIQLVVLDYSSRGYEEIEVKVGNENLFNLINVNQGYFISYSQRNNGTPLLEQIDYNEIIEKKILDILNASQH